MRLQIWSVVSGEPPVLVPRRTDVAWLLELLLRRRFGSTRGLCSGRLLSSEPRDEFPRRLLDLVQIVTEDLLLGTGNGVRSGFAEKRKREARQVLSRAQ
jgi:hypothetical protein